jgi:hypothetical protein
MSERRGDETHPEASADQAMRERIRRAWRDIHEALYYAANATRCDQYTDHGTLRARRGDICGDLDALRCMEQGGHLPVDTARRYERMHADFSALMRLRDGDAVNAEVEEFIAAVGELETQFWTLVPVEQLPVEMFASLRVGASGRIRLVRRSRRAGDFVI